MKETIYLLSILLICLSCSDEIETDNFQETRVIDGTSRTIGDGTYEALGFSYDITDNYLGENSVKLKVIDVEAFIKDNRDRFYNPFIGTIDQRSYAGENAESFMHDIITKSNFEGSVAATNSTDKEKGFFSGTIKTGFSSENKYSYSTKYSFARVEVLKKQRHYFLHTDIQTLSKYLASTFKEDLNNYSADKIVELYGTHVLTNITVGGTYTAFYKSVITEVNNKTEKTATVSAGAKYSLSRVGLDANGSWSNTEITEMNKKNSDWICNIKCIGGSTSGTTITLSSNNQGPSYTINLGSWTESVDDTHSKLVDVDWNYAYPIYELVSDLTKKKQLEEAVKKYINSKQIIMLNIVPLYEGYHVRGGDHLYTLDKNEISKFGYNDNGIACYVLSPDNEEKIGYKPVYRGYNKQMNDHYYTTTYDEFRQHGYTYERTEFYISPTLQDCTMPFYQGYKDKDGDHFYTLNFSMFAQHGYSYQTILGYVFPQN